MDGRCCVVAMAAPWLQTYTSTAARGMSFLLPSSIRDRMASNTDSSSAPPSWLVAAGAAATSCVLTLAVVRVTRLAAQQQQQQQPQQHLPKPQITQEQQQAPQPQLQMLQTACVTPEPDALLVPTSTQQAALPTPTQPLPLFSPVDVRRRPDPYDARPRSKCALHLHTPARRLVPCIHTLVAGRQTGRQAGPPGVCTHILCIPSTICACACCPTLHHHALYPSL